MSDLDFIKDKTLRVTLENSIEYIYALFEQSKNEALKDLYKEETHRVIILYVISAIEAVLLYLFKERGEKMEYPEYKFVTLLPDKFIHNDKKDSHVIIAVQDIVGKKDYQIGLNDIVMFFKTKYGN